MTLLVERRKTLPRYRPKPRKSVRASSLSSLLCCPQVLREKVSYRADRRPVTERLQAGRLDRRQLAKA